MSALMFNIIWQFVMVKQSIDTHKQTIDAHTTQTIDTHKHTTMPDPYVRPARTDDDEDPKRLPQPPAPAPAPPPRQAPSSCPRGGPSSKSSHAIVVAAQFERISLRLQLRLRQDKRHGPRVRRSNRGPPQGRRGALVVGVERGSRRGGLGQPDPTTTVCVKTSALTAWMTLLEVTSTTAL